MATAQPNTGTNYSLPPTSVPGQPPLNQLNPGMVNMVNAGQEANDPANRNGGTADPNITMQNGVAISKVDPNSLAGNQLATLMSSNSPLNQLALAQGQAQAAATGNANGTLMAGAAQTALDQQLTPYAMQQAGMYGQTEQNNANAINQLQNTRTQVHGQIMAAGVSANASMHNAQLASDTAKSMQTQSLAQNAQQFSDNWSNQFKMATQSQAFQKASQDSQNEFTAKYNTLNTAFQTVMSDPSYWSNPQASMGMINYFSSNIDALLGNMGIGGTAGANTNIPSVAP